MPFYLYAREEFLEEQYKISVAGKAIRNLWEAKGRPIGGWHISLDDILMPAGKNSNSHAVMIDLNPSKNDEITLLELLGIHVFTYGKPEEANWSVLMLKLRERFYFYQKERNLTPQKRAELIQRVIPNKDLPVTEFLYLQGKGWNWGAVGRVNGALIYDDAREFFKQYF